MIKKARHFFLYPKQLCPTAKCLLSLSPALFPRLSLKMASPYFLWSEKSTVPPSENANTQTHKCICVYTNTNAQLQMHNYCPYILWNEKRTAPPFNENFWQRHFLAVSFKWAFKGYWMFYYSLQSSESLFLQVHDFVLILLEQRPKSNSNEGGET